MRNITMAAATAGLLFSTAAYADSKTYELSGFDKIDIATGLDAVVKLGDDFSVIATTGSPQALDNLQLEVKDGVLVARFDQNFLDFIVSGGLVGMLLTSGNALTIDVTLPALAAVDASSGADVRAEGLISDRLRLSASSGADIHVTDAKLGAVELDASSGADLDISGTADSVDAEASSGSGIDAQKLIAVSAKAGASSGANISIHATGSIDAEASSGGDIEVGGNPADRDTDASSGGDISFDD